MAMDSALGTGQLGWRSQDCVPCRAVQKSCQGTVRITQHLGSLLSSLTKLEKELGRVAVRDGGLCRDSGSEHFSIQSVVPRPDQQCQGPLYY